MLLLRGEKCECCGIPKKGKALQVHHLKPADYESLDPDQFSVLCGECHKLVERFARRLHGKNSATISNRENWLLVLGKFIPEKEEK